MNVRTALQNFVAGFVKKPAPETVESFAFCMKREEKRKDDPEGFEGKEMNHEIWRTCNSCGECFDVKKELKFICPNCGSVDLRV